MTIEIKRVNYDCPDQGADLIFLLNAYALDPMGGGVALSSYTKSNLIRCLSERADALSFIAYVDAKPVGLANCFQNFSSFACKPVLNIHDFAVLPEYRGRGVARCLLESIEQEAREQSCCKLTLEVLSGNKTAQKVYRGFGFGAYELDSKTGQALFWEKPI
ncbi:MAG: GNAT family N-acetyltransferase [Pseudohongiellaceae bacterium]|nr:GNAT family N-acetyltransferase [Pseudohongiellaceae bacterium]